VLSSPQTLHFKVDTSVPVATLSAPGMTVPTYAGRSFKVSWNASKSLSGPARYDVDYRTSTTAAWKRWRQSDSTSAMFTAAAGSNIYFRARAISAAGRVGPYTATRQTVVPYDQSKARFSSGWKTSTSSGYYLGSTRYTTKKGASTSLSFTKGTLYLVARTSPKLGKIAVYYRGSKVATVNLHSTKTKYRQVFRILSRSTGTKSYTVKLVNLGTKNHTRVEVDGFAIKR